MRILPEKFDESMHTLLKEQYSQFVSSLQEPSPVSIRTHPLKGRRPATRQPVPWTLYGEYLPVRPIFTLDPLFHAGAYYVQDASSMFLEQALKQTLDLRQPLNVLDLCAAPGGKSTDMLSMLSRDSLLVSNETIRSRASILSENIQKWGYPNCIVTQNDPSDFRKLTGFFDVIVVDAPCSGEGLFRKEPEAMDEWSPEHVQLCAARQKRIVSDVWDALREDGLFIYCTCTYNTSENEENLMWLRSKSDVEFIRLSVDPSWGVEEVADDNIFAYRFFPHKAKGEGFFMAVMRKREATEALRIRPRKAIANPSKHTHEALTRWKLPGKDAVFFQFNDLIFYTPSSKVKEIEFLLQSLRIVYAGTNMATLKRDKLVPDHAMALSVELNRENFPYVTVSEEEALKYLRKDNIHLADAAMGFTLLICQHLPIGWVNVLSNRVNNMYPSEWKIRM